MPGPARDVPGAECAAALGSSVFLCSRPGSSRGLIPGDHEVERRRGRPSAAEGCRVRSARGRDVRAALGLRAIRDRGFGTPAPVAPTQRLVVGGLYRYVRNPMYLAVLAIIVGQAIVLWRPSSWGTGRWSRSRSSCSSACTRSPPSSERSETTTTRTAAPFPDGGRDSILGRDPELAPGQCRSPPGEACCRTRSS